jgi:hypothetical protein
VDREVELIVGIDDPKFSNDPDGFCSKDDCRAVMRNFFQRYGILDSEKFTCFSVREQIGQIGIRNVAGGTLSKAQTADAWGVKGKQYLGKPDLIKQIAVVCAGDFQTVVCNAVKEILNGHDINSYVDRFVNVQGKSENEIRNAISNALEKRSPYHYAEARIFRCLADGDVEPYGND